MITDPHTIATAAFARRRARLSLAGIGVALILLVATIAFAGLLAFPGSDHAGGRVTPAPRPQAGSGKDPNWDWAGEASLATRPMLVLPAESAAPEPLSLHPAPGALRVPVPSGDLAGVPAGFPATPAGTVAALAAMTTQGLRGADPQTYVRAYRALSLPGSPPAESARLVHLLSSIRSSAGIPPIGPVAGLTMGWQPEEGLVKGVLDGGRYVVACVLGQFTADYQGRLVTYGVGDCQALRWTLSDPATGATGQWLISPGPGAATATDAWPGSQDAVNAGYQALQR